MSFTVAIIGRPNVGKSTLFNRLIGEQKSIVADQSGVTRDRVYGVSNWGGKNFNVIDTGGFVAHSEEVFEKAIRNQVKIAIEEANLLLFVIDVTTGITDLDDQLIHLLRRTKKECFLVVNKVDNNQRMFEAAEFYGLGFEHTFFLSSINGSGTGELLEELIKRITEDFEEPTTNPEIPRVAILGQPNVGKSSLINVLIENDRNIVTDIAGTTRDTINSHYNKFGRELYFIDTAGIRKKAKVHEDIEFYSVIRAIKAIDEASVCVIMLDAKEGLTQQDLSIFRLCVKKRKGVLIAVNKWDLIEKETNTLKEYEDFIKSKLAPFSDVPIMFISVHEKQRILKMIDELIELHQRLTQKIGTAKLNEMIQEAVAKFSPPAYKGKFISIKYATQLPARCPTIALFCNHPKYIREPYRNYLENFFRKQLSLSGVPLNIFFREK